jgi:hypothetical protein
MDVDAITRAVDEAKARVQAEVMDPLMEWMEAYKVLSVRLHMGPLMQQTVLCTVFLMGSHAG